MSNRPSISEIVAQQQAALQRQNIVENPSASELIAQGNVELFTTPTLLASIPEATPTQRGLESAEDKAKLDGIDAQATHGADWDANITNKPTLGTAAAKNIPATGNASSTEVVYGTDTRLADARTPTTHTHVESALVLTDLTTNDATTGRHGFFPKLPASTGKFLRDDMTWQAAGAGGAHASTHVTGGGDTIANAVAGGNAGLMSGADKTKLDGVASGATVGADWNTNVANKPTLGTAAAHAQEDFSPAATAALGLHTGVLTGCVLSINGSDNTKVDVSAGTCRYIDNSDPTNPTVETLTVAGTTVTPTVGADGLGTLFICWCGISRQSAGVGVPVFSTEFSETERRTTCVLGRMWATAIGSASIAAVTNYQSPAWGAAKTLEDLAYALGGAINIDGNDFTAHTGQLTLDKSAGHSFRIYGASGTSKNVPNNPTNAAITPITAYRYWAASGTSYGNALSSTIDPNYYDNSGTRTAVTAGKWTIQRVYYFSGSSTVAVSYGQAMFDTLDAAKAAANTQVIVFSDMATRMFHGGLLRARVYVQQGATDLSAAYVERMTAFVGGGAGGGGGTVYDHATLAHLDYASAGHTGFVPGTRKITSSLDLSADRSLTYSDVGAASTSDARLSDARTPTAHKTTHATGGGDALTAADIGADVAGAASTVAGNLSTHAGLTTTAHGGLVPPTRKITTTIDLSADRNLTYSDVGADASGAAATVAGNLSTHAGLTTTAHGGLVASGDARLTDDRTASGLRSATTVVSVSAATAPIAGQALVAIANNAAAWSTITAAAATLNPNLYVTTADASVPASSAIRVSNDFYEIGAGYVLDVATDGVFEVMGDPVNSLHSHALDAFEPNYYVQATNQAIPASAVLFIAESYYEVPEPFVLDIGAGGVLSVLQL